MKNRSHWVMMTILFMALMAIHCAPHQVPQGEKHYYHTPSSPPPEK